jgi:hypothetical protein
LLWFVPILWVTPFKLGLELFLAQLSLFILTLLILGKVDDQAASTWCLLAIPGVVAGELLKNVK